MNAAHCDFTLHCGTNILVYDAFKPFLKGEEREIIQPSAQSISAHQCALFMFIYACTPNLKQGPGAGVGFLVLPYYMISFNQLDPGVIFSFYICWQFIFKQLKLFFVCQVSF